MSADLRYGMLTYLFTDLEGSTQLWDQHPGEMDHVLVLHDAILEKAIESHDGIVVKKMGDGMLAVFDSANKAVDAALTAQLAFAQETWPDATGAVRVRIGLHSGESHQREGDYFGPNLNRASRIMDVGYGGQILLSAATASLVRQALVNSDGFLLDLGEHSLKDLTQPEHIFQLSHPALETEFPVLKSLARYKHNLPRQLTSFVGREREVSEVKELLAGSRLLTLLGPGGTGKTRLMLQVGADVIDTYPDGVWLVELASLSDPEQLTSRVASVFNIQDQPGRTPLELLTNYLRNKDSLLLIDNVEHLVEESAILVEHLLLNCPKLKFLVTGREGLFIGGETTLQIPSLSLPVGEFTAEVVCSSEAVQLFYERAQAVQPSFEVDDGNAPAVAEICRRLDGIPLALELAASKLRLLSVEQIAERLNDRFQLLTGGRRTALPRQQTLAALIDWSWNLLEAHEQTSLRRLSVFSGGWTLEAAEYVAGLDGIDTFSAIDQLVNKSLVIAEQQEDNRFRHRMLESIHQYARIKLLEAGEVERVRDRHAEYYANFAIRASEALMGADMLQWLGPVFQEIDNARSARDWALEGRLDLTVHMLGAIFLINRFYWFTPLETLHWLEQVVKVLEFHDASAPESDLVKDYAAAKIALGSTLVVLGELDKARENLEIGNDLARQTGALRPLVWGLNMQSLIALNQEEFDEALEFSQESIAIGRENSFEFELSMAYSGTIGQITQRDDRQAEAEEYIREVLQLAETSGNPWINAMAFVIKGRTAKARGNYEQARDNFIEASELFASFYDKGFETVWRSESAHIMRKLGDISAAEDVYRETIHVFYEGGHMPGVAHQLECFAYIAIEHHQFERAAKLLGAAQAIRQGEGGANPTPPEKIEFDLAKDKLRTELGEAELEKLILEGQKLNVEGAIEYAVS
jgi:predicted ATPase/class 3 adenylate cyclase